MVKRAYLDRQNRRFTDFILMKSANNFGKSTMKSVKEFLGMDTNMREPTPELDQSTIDSSWKSLAGAFRELR